MDYAVFRTGGKQYKVSPGNVIDVDKMPVEPGSQIELGDVLAVSRDGHLTLGTPVVEGARVVVQVEDQVRDSKIIVFKYKRKVRYRRKKGHRQPYTRLAIRQLLLEGEEALPEEPVAVAEPVAEVVEEAAEPEAVAEPVPEPEPVAVAEPVADEVEGAAEPEAVAEEVPEAEAVPEEAPSPRRRTHRTTGAETGTTTSGTTRRRRTQATASEEAPQAEGELEESTSAEAAPEEESPAEEPPSVPEEEEGEP